VGLALLSGRVRISRSESDPERVGPHSIVFESDTVELDGTRVSPRKTQFSAVLHKPTAVTTTARDPRGKQDLQRWLRQMPPGMFPVGRLDRDTTGLLLFTTDGDLCNSVLQPRGHTDKLYWLWLNEVVTDDDPRLLELCSGVRVGEMSHRAAKAWIRRSTSDYTELYVTLQEGKKRQIRRMCRALDLRLLHLHRLRVGPIELDSLGAGEWRLLEASEVDELWHCTGGREAMFQRRVLALMELCERRRAEGNPLTRLEAWFEDRGLR
jgi:23S rRNA pseudouridine2605 synthase